MTCHECERLLQCYLEGEPIPDRAALDAHLAVCSTCRSQWTAAMRLDAGLRQVRPVVSSPELCARIVAHVLVQQRASRRLRRGVAAAAALAAVVLVAVVLVRFWPQRSHGPTRLDDSSIADETPAPPPVRETSDAAPSLRESITQVAQLTLRKADDTVGEARALLPRPLANDGVPAPPNGTPPAQRLREAGSGIGAGLEPVADSAKRAWSLFLREIPAVRPGEKRGA
jgi:hypothetical protein